MPITVTTGGPLVIDGPIAGGGTVTFGGMVDAISDEIDDTTGEYYVQIQRAIIQSIRYCEREPYYFNQTLDITFQTIAGREFYDGADHEQIPRLVRIETAYCEWAGQRRELRRGIPADIELLSDNSAVGEPYCYAYFDRRLRLYPVPNGAFTIRLQLTPYRLAEMTDLSDTNSWLTEAFSLVKARAKYEMYKNILKDATLAVEAMNDFNDQHSALRAETSRRNGRGVIIGTVF